MFRQLNFNSMFIGIGVCALFVLAGYRYLSDIGYRPSPKTITQNILNNAKTDKQEYIDTILEMTRTMVKIEMWNYNFNHSGVDKLEDLVMESGGNPVRTIIVSTWRSGSSFLGDLIASVPATFYSYEPLTMLGQYNQIRGPPNGLRALSFLKNIMKCNLNSDNDLIKHFKLVKNNLKNSNIFSHNKKFWDKCNYKQELCYDTDFSAKFCKLFPFNTIKLDRLRLSLVKNMLEDQDLNVKVVLLVRDPRGVMQSRRDIKNFCSKKNVPDCADAKLVCSDMVADYTAAAEFLLKYPNRLMVLRYEDLALNLNVTTTHLLKFLRLEPTQSVHKFLNTHTAVSNSQHYSTFRVTKNIPFKWRKTMKFNAVKEVQEKCKDAMSLWGYEQAHNASHMASKTFNPLLPYSVKLPNIILDNSNDTTKLDKITSN